MRLALSILALGLTVQLPSAGAQCTADWQSGLAWNGITGNGLALTVFDEGSGPMLAVGGEFYAAGSASSRNVAAFAHGHWTSLGAGLDGPLSYPGLDHSVHALRVFDDGSGPALFAGGAFTRSGTSPVLHIARWDGTSWLQVGAGLDLLVRALVVFDDGSGPALFAGGTPPAGSSVVLAKWNGNTWTSLPPLANSSIDSLEVFDEGGGPRLFAGGMFAPGGFRDGILRWDGSAWSRVGAGLDSDSVVYAMHAFDDGSGSALYVGGQIVHAGTTSAANIARWNGTSWSALGSGIGQGLPSALAHFDDGMGPKLYAAGHFTLAGGAPVSNIARWSGSSWSGVSTGIAGDAFVSALLRFDDGSGTRLFATGTVSTSGPLPVGVFTQWDGVAWSNPDSTTALGAGFGVQTMVAHDDGTGEALYVAGSQHGVLARFNGSTWSPVGGGFDGPIVALASVDDGSGRKLCASGGFLHAGATAADHIACWDGSSWRPLGAGLDNTAFCMLEYDDGTGVAVYAGGFFTLAGGVSAPYVARWNGTSWSSVGSGLTAPVRSLAAYDDGSGRKLWAASWGGGGVNRWDGSSWTQVGSGLSLPVCTSLCVFDDGHGPRLFVVTLAAALLRWDNSANWQLVSLGIQGVGPALAVFDDGSGPALYAGSEQVSPYEPVTLARFDGESWSSLGSGIGGGYSATIRALAVAKIGASSVTGLYFAGDFSTAGSTASASLAEWRGCGANGAPFCLGDLASSGCPCANVGAAHRGCENSASTGGAQLRASGTTQPDTLTFTCSGELPSSLSILLQGTSVIAPVAFGDGVRCVGGTLKRLYVYNAVAGTLVAPSLGDPPVSLRSAALGDAIAPGTMRAYQVYYRDPSVSFCASPIGDTWNLSSGLRVDW